MIDHTIYIFVLQMQQNKQKKVGHTCSTPSSVVAKEKGYYQQNSPETKKVNNMTIHKEEKHLNLDKGKSKFKKYKTYRAK